MSFLKDKLFVRSASVVSLALAAACGGPVDDLEPADVDGSESGIVNGYAPDAWWHQATVSIHRLVRPRRGTPYVSNSPFCSGTLIDADVVLTAAHCMVGRVPSDVFVSTHDAPVTVATSAFQSLALPSSQISVHPSYNSSQLTDDVALIRLVSPVAGVAPVPAVPGGAITSTTTVVLATIGGKIATNFAGYGYSVLTRKGAKVTKSGLGTLLQFDDVIEGVGCHIAGCPNTNDPALVDATQFAYTQGDGGPCNGDSGGPAFVFVGDPESSPDVYVAGITSYGDANCLTYGVSTRVDAYTDNFIANFLAP